MEEEEEVEEKVESMKVIIMTLTRRKPLITMKTTKCLSTKHILLSKISFKIH